MKKYHHIFFDLDRTLWDFGANSSETLIDILDKFKLQDIVHKLNVGIQKSDQIKKASNNIGTFREKLNDY